MRSILVFAVGLLVGAFAHRAGVHREMLRLMGVHPLGRRVALAQPADSGMTVTAWREQVGMHGYLALLTVGQSQAANFGERLGDERDSTWVLVGQRVHRSGSPIPGVEGVGGSVWPRLAARLERQHGRPVLIVPLAIGATRIREWEPSNPLGRRLQHVADDAITSGLIVSAVLFMQGEADAAAGTAPEDWVRSFRTIADNLWPEGKAPPLYVATESRCYQVPVSISLQQAQRSVVDGVSVFAGPDIDRLGPAFRWDGCHLTTAGLDSLGAWWAQTLAAPGVVRAGEHQHDRASRGAS